MADLFGNLITVPEPTIDGVYPIALEPDIERSSGAEYVAHKIGLKKEQRIIKRKSGNRWKLRHTFLSQSDLDNTLKPFFDAHRNPRDLFYFYDPFEQPCPDDTGAETVGRYTVRFLTTELEVSYLRDGAAEVEVELIEVNTSTDAIFIGVGWQYYNWRRPGEALPYYVRPAITNENGLIHFAKIKPIGVEDSIFVSDRRVELLQTFGPTPTARSGIYLPRLLAWDIQQEIGSSDQATFVFDDADSVWSEYCKQVDLDRAEMDFTVHVAPDSGASNLQQLWRGYIVDWEWNHREGTFTAQCEGGIAALQQQFPPRLVSTTCPLRFNDGGECPYATQGSGGDPDTCDKSLEGPNGCNAHGMTNYFQGVVIKPQTATGKLNNTGFAGLFKKSYTSTSTPLKTIYGKPLPIVYGEGRQIIEAEIFETRDESEFFVASGIVSEGPVGNIGQVLLDGMTQHTGYQPVRALGTLGQNTGTIIDPSFRSSRLSFVSIRRTDEVGLQNPNETHRILVEILDGVKVMTFWWWTGPFANNGEFSSSNPIHIAIDVALRSLGLRYAPYFESGYANWVKDFLVDLNAYRIAEQFCYTQVPSLIGTGNENRYEYRGTIREPKPAIDHIREILSNAPIDLVWSYGQLSPKPRKDDITTPPPYQITLQEASNIIDGTFSAQRLKPRFNQLTLLYSDINYDFAERDITVYDEAHQLRVGFYEQSSPNLHKPLVLKQQRSLSGGFRASQVIRLATQELAEELGGGIGNEEEQRKARMVSLTAPLVGLAIEVGDVSKVIHSELPDGQAYVRWKSWRYSSDYQVQLSGPTVTASMYASPIPQLPSSTAGDSVVGIPGGSQGSDGSENEPSTLPAPVLTLVSIDYRTAQVGRSCEPDPLPAPQAPDQPPTWIPAPQGQNPIPPPSDLVAPTTPTSLSGAALTYRIDLSWNASGDNVGVTGYLIERCSGASCTDFVQIATPSAVAPSVTLSNEVQTLAITADSGSFTLIYDTNNTTAAIAWNANAAAVQSALEALPLIGAGNVIVTGTNPNFTVTFTGDLAGTATPLLTLATNNLLIGSSPGDVTIVRLTAGGEVVSAQVEHYVDTGLTAETSYSYRIRARDESGNLSSYSSVFTATTQPAPVDTTPPSTPSSLTATPV